MITRSDVIQSYLDLFPRPHYLEIGVSEGATFHAVRAAKKVAVDPAFKIPLNQRDPLAEYHEITSDQYFNDLGSGAAEFEVIYLDGHHTFEQTLRDLMNAINVLRRDGVIVIDDVSPNSYHSSLPDHRESVAVQKAVRSMDPSWMGDTYRLVFFVQSFLPRFNYATVEDNHGQLVMWREERSLDLFVERKVEDISRLEFRHIVAERTAFHFLPNEDIARRIRLAAAAGGLIQSRPLEELPQSASGICVSDE